MSFPEAAISSWSALLRSAVLVVMLSIAATAGVVGGAWGAVYILTKSGYAIQGETYTAEKTPLGLAFTLGSSSSSLTVLSLPATAGWVNTTLVLDPTRKYSVKAGGQVHLGLRHLLDKAIAHEPLDFPWTGPDGYDFKVLRPVDKLRKPLLVFPGNIGALLGVVVGNSEAPPSWQQPRPKGMFVIGSGKEISGSGGTLYIAVNDMVPDFEKGADAFVGDVDDASRPKAIEAWKKVVAEKSANIWFDDNMGQYLVSVEHNRNR
jgi:hypothetical protein